MENLDFQIVDIERIVERPGSVNWSMSKMYYDNQYVLVIALEGEAQYMLEEELITVRKNDVYIFSPRTLRSGKSNPKNPWSFISIIFTMDVNEEAQSYFDRTCMRWKNVGDVIRSRFFEACHAWTGKNALYKVKCKNLVSEILYELIQADLPYHQMPHIKKLEAARSYIQENFRTEISVEALAEQHEFSPSYFRRLFRAAYGASPMQYIMNLRINYARDLLMTGELNVTEVSRLCGFDDIYYFSTVFKKKTGTTPTQFMRRN